MKKNVVAAMILLGIFLLSSLLSAAPITIGAQFNKDKVRWGETLGVTYGVRNNTSQKQFFDVWGEVKYEGSTIQTFGPEPAKLPPNFKTRKTVYGEVPSLTPPGTYTAYLYAGPYPTVWSSAQDSVKVVIFDDGSIGFLFEERVMPKSLFDELFESITK